ncbi:condensation domain-containing protein [Actinoallomurus sp. NPDC050550]|uniref:condensation domain-containing protein n=1 Tax=Actinoallomurus sp. NPDC050550 TaxID=3154937 RepID=UPI0033D58571
MPPDAPFPLSLEQEFLRLQHQNDGSAGDFGPRLISSGGWRLTGDLDLGVFRRALDDVVARHEALRTSLLHDADGWRQRVHPPGASPALEVRDLSGEDGTSRQERAEAFLNDVEAQTFDMSRVPAFWAHVGRLADDDWIVVLIAHLPVVDVWSLSLVMRDLVELYAARRERREPELPEARQYREYAAHQRTGADEKTAARSYDYWRDRLRHAQAVTLPTDHPPVAGAPSGTRCDRFAVDAELGSAAVEFGRSLRCTPFMVLFAAYRVHLLARTGQADAVVWTLSPGPGRHRRWMADTVGYFVNFFPLRTDLTGCRTFRDVVERVREACLAAFRHEVPFVRLAAEAAEQIAALEQADRITERARPGFQMSPHPFMLRERESGGVGCVAAQRRTSQPLGPDIPDDAILWTAELGAEGELVFAVNSSVDRFDQPSMDAMADEFTRVLRAGVTDPDIALDALTAAIRPATASRGDVA